MTRFENPNNPFSPFQTRWFQRAKSSSIRRTVHPWNPWMDGHSRHDSQPQQFRYSSNRRLHLGHRWLRRQHHNLPRRKLPTKHTSVVCAEFPKHSPVSTFSMRCVKFLKYRRLFIPDQSWSVTGWNSFNPFRRNIKINKMIHHVGDGRFPCRGIFWGEGACQSDAAATPLFLIHQLLAESASGCRFPRSRWLAHILRADFTTARGENFAFYLNYA